MAIQTARLQKLLHLVVDQGLGRNLPHDAVAYLHDEISALEEEVPETVDPYAGKSQDELLAQAQQGDKGALDRYVENQKNPASGAGADGTATTAATPATPVYSTTTPTPAPTVAAGEAVQPA